MNTASKLCAYMVVLAVVFATALALGNVLGPVSPAADQSPAVQTENGLSGMGMDGDG